MSLQARATTEATTPIRPGPSALERHIIRLASDSAGLMTPNLDAAGFDDAFVAARPAVKRALGRRGLPDFLASLERRAATCPDAGGCRLAFVVAHGPAAAMAATLADRRTREVLAGSYARHLAGAGAEVALSPVALDAGHAVALGPGGIRAAARAGASAQAADAGGSVGRALADALPAMRVGAVPEADGSELAVAHVVVVATRGESRAPGPASEDAMERFLSDAGHALAPSGLSVTHVGETLSGAVSAMSREMLAMALETLRVRSGIPADEPPEVVHLRVDVGEVVVVAEHEGWTLEPVHVPMALVSRDLEAFASDLADLSATGSLVTYDEGEAMPEPGPPAPALAPVW